jgi:2-dehydropantoate 2-reductase
MKVCVVGMGAIGSLFAARLAGSGVAVTALARGAAYSALQERGVALVRHGHTTYYPVNAVEDAQKVGPHDLVVLAVKGPALAAAARSLRPLLGPQTIVLGAMNGVPWWLLHGAPAPWRGGRIASVDPDGTLETAIALHHVLGCVVYPNCSQVAPGVAEHHFGERLVIGEPGGGTSVRARRVAALLGQAGFAVELSESIEQDIWEKLLGNMTHNPVSALTGAPCDRLLDDELLSTFCENAMNEAIQVGASLGWQSRRTARDCNAQVRALGSFKTSMLQDAEHGRPLEIDSLLGAVSELGRKVGTSTPNVDALFGMTRVFGRMRGLY